MVRSNAWQPIEDEVLKEGVGLTLDDLCNAVNSLRRSRGWGGFRSVVAVKTRCGKLGVRYKKNRRMKEEDRHV